MLLSLSLPTPFFTGLATSAGLIIAIGAQNAFVLSQGVRREYHWPIAGLCSFIDAVLIVLGIAGMGVLIGQSEVILQIITWGGALFLFWYGANALRSALRSEALDLSESQFSGLQSALLTTLALSLLNPHVYLDTLVLLGGIGGRYPEGDRYWFGAGAALFSFVWFFSLSLGARWLAPLFRNPLSWRVLDGLVCIMMWTLAGLLLSDNLV
ncbi:LysE/ArgO family amino acid transporter [Amphritea japonica]|uniref:L-lysine exporter family protein LysE/ArgO n=1 Tax=Amphritea japonica ATCC BAA-1530 TaxID=1278309 RepID=A0A7R6PGA1_9GAMM|nr:LysE/ArgO family amino acid transporter [Amphritea japonica]BBB25917.1 L-lysine exporter family protein LysE/ArgO [Amphritea japonica ATCC BAA-1530]